MLSADERFIITYNGEVYSHQPVARELTARGIKFRGYSTAVAGRAAHQRFWDARAVAREGIRSPLTDDDADLIEQLETLLQEAVSRRMIADVPLGAFLSDGIDSSRSVAQNQRAWAPKQ